jgi:hypothetical protein
MRIEQILTTDLSLWPMLACRHVEVELLRPAQAAQSALVLPDYRIAPLNLGSVPTNALLVGRSGAGSCFSPRQWRPLQRN